MGASKAKEIHSQKKKIISKLERVKKVSTDKRYKKEHVSSETEELKKMIKELFEKNKSNLKKTDAEENELSELKREIEELTKKLNYSKKEHEQQIGKISEIVDEKSKKNTSKLIDLNKIKKELFELEQIHKELKLNYPNNPRIKSIEEKINQYKEKLNSMK